MSQIDISITPEAYKKAMDLRKNNKEYQGKGLRLYLDGKGCDGFYYGVSFDQKSKEDLYLEVEDLEILIDEETYYFCAGSTIKWLVHEELGEGFLVDNPDHRKFRGKFYKRKSFQAAYENRDSK